MAVRALLVAQPVPDHRRAAPQTLLAMTRHTLEIGMHSLQRIIGQTRVIEGVDLERVRDVTYVAFSQWIREPKLPRMGIPMTTGARSRSAAIGRTAAALPVILGGPVTAIARGVGVSARQRPDAVIDLGCVPPGRRMTAPASSLRHFFGELLAVGILMTVDALSCPHPKIVPGALRRVAVAAWDCLMLAFQGEIGAGMLSDGEEGGPETMLVVARGAIRRSELTTVHVSMTIAARCIPQGTIASRHRQLRKMTSIAGHLVM